MRNLLFLMTFIGCFGFSEEKKSEKSDSRNTLSFIPSGEDPLQFQFNKNLQEELLIMEQEDQSARSKISLKNVSSQEWKLIEEIDKAHNHRLREIISSFGWPGIHLVGFKGASSMWLLVQHQDNDLPLQKQCLLLLKKAVENQDAQYKEYAYLLDRVRMNENLSQVYGTQWIQKEEKLVLYPEDPKNLNQRRLEAGLCSIEEYIEQLKAFYHLETVQK